MNFHVFPYQSTMGDYTLIIESKPGKVEYSIYRNGNSDPVATGGGYKRDLVGKQAVRRLQEFASAKQQ